jgi:hypothetical protein
MKAKTNKKMQPKNGQIINNLEELKKHSKIMENLPSKEKLKKYNMQPDPKQ